MQLFSLKCNFIFCKGIKNIYKEEDSITCTYRAGQEVEKFSDFNQKLDGKEYKKDTGHHNFSDNSLFPRFSPTCFLRRKAGENLNFPKNHGDPCLPYISLPLAFFMCSMLTDLLTYLY